MNTIHSRARSRARESQRGFTLIEILVVIGMIGILAATVLVAVNPLRQFAQARNTQRISNVNAILNAIGSRIADNKGLFAGTGCSVVPGTAAATMASGNNNGIDIRPCLVPNYIAELPTDPSAGSNTCTDVECTNGAYDTGYTVAINEYNRVTVCAPHSVDDGDAAPYCLSR